MIMQGTGRDEYNAHYFRMCEYIANVNNKQYLIDRLKAEPDFSKRNGLIANLNENWKTLWQSIYSEMENIDKNEESLTILDDYLTNMSIYKKWLFIYSKSTRILTSALTMLLYAALEKHLTSYLFHISELQNYANSVYAQDSEHAMYDYLLKRVEVLAIDDICRTTDPKYHKYIDSCLSSRAFNTKMTIITSTLPVYETGMTYHADVVNTIVSNSQVITLK